jgi:hypothetical protein
LPDFTVCVNLNCPLKISCFRYLSIWSEFQSAAFFIPDMKEGEFKSCSYYWNVSEKTGLTVSLEEADERARD